MASAAIRTITIVPMVTSIRTATTMSASAPTITSRRTAIIMSTETRSDIAIRMMTETVNMVIGRPRPR